MLDRLAFFVFALTAAAATASPPAEPPPDDGAPPRPAPPSAELASPDVLRVGFRSVDNGWVRDTAYVREPGGEWQLASDRLRRADASPPTSDGTDRD